MRTIFVGSSKEALTTAEKVAGILQKEGVKPLLWTEAFKAGDLTLEALEKTTDLVSGAIFLASPDDDSTIRDKKVKVPRANVIYEYGYFTSTLGRHKVALCCFDKAVMPSDLLGLTHIRMGSFRKNQKLLDGPSKQIRDWVRKISGGEAEIGLRKALSMRAYSHKLNLPVFSSLSANFEEMRAKVEEVRNEFVKRLRELGAGLALQDTQIRASVFIPAIERSPPGLIYELYMEHRISIHMDYPPEWDIRFQPEEGAVGAAFASGGQYVNCDRTRLLSERHQHLVHEDLSWVISLPVKNKMGNVLAVLNIDGLGIHFEKEILEKIGSGLAFFLSPLADLLDRCKKCGVYTLTILEDAC